MGAASSTAKPADNDSKTFYAERETPVTFAPSLIHHLSDSSESSTPSAQRQSSLDAHIRERIQRELAQLRKDEEDVTQEISRALERENAEKEKETPGGLDSRQIEKELEALRGKIERQRRRKDGIEGRVAPKRDAVVKCYEANPERTLDCWREVADFKDAVAEIQRVRSNIRSPSTMTDIAQEFVQAR